MRRNHSCLAVTFFVLFLSASAPGYGDVLLSNLGEPLRDTSTLDVNLWAAQSFATDANGHFLTGIESIVGNGTLGVAAVAELRQGTASSIDTSAIGLLTTFTTPNLSGALSTLSFSPNSSVALAPNTYYWFILGVNGPGSFDWSYANTNNVIGPGSLGNFEYSANQGASWTNFGSDFPYYLQVDVSVQAVPEPSTLALCGLCLLGAAATGLYRRVKLSKVVRAAF